MRGFFRLVLVASATVLALGSASTNNQTPAPQAMPQAQPAEGGAYGPPASQPMESQRAHGLWKSNFGPVKIEPDDSAGGDDAVMGVWVYDRDGQEVIGYFHGPLDGNVLEFTWQEPSQPEDLTGSGYLVFDPAGRSFSGRWWTESRDRNGEWNGWRGDKTASGPSAADGATPPEGDAQAGEGEAVSEEEPAGEPPAGEAPPPPKQ